jgi:glutamine cyclotransferase
MRVWLLLLALMLPLAADGAQERPVEAAQVLRRLPHDAGAYTEGLFIDHGQLFESTGQVGRSSVRRVDLDSGRVLARFETPGGMFGEGIAPWKGQILSLSWRDGIGLRLGRENLRLVGRFDYAGEGWGMTVRPSDGMIVMSDGTDTLRFVDGAGFTVTRRLKVRDGARAVDQINELEWVDGEILANIWLTDRIARIDPATGRVKGWIDVAALHREAGAMGTDQVANGIAWDAVGRHLYVTGKEWPVMFEIRVPRQH